MNRVELQKLAEDRLLDAKALLSANRWSGAYYLAGYAVECALKSCILVRVDRTGVIFEEKKFSEQCWTHDFETLLGLAGLETVRRTEFALNPMLAKNWQTVKDWKEISRYEQKTQSQAQELFDAIDDNTNGVMKWIRNHW
jgi:HEPN domain-containing protein